MEKTISSAPNSAGFPTREPAKIKKLLIVSDAWLPQVNGVVRTLQTTVRHLTGFGVDIEVVGPNRFRNAPLPTYPEIRLALTRTSEIGRIIERFAPDAVHIATEGPLGWLTRRWMQQQSLPFTTSFHTMFPQYVEMRTGIPERYGFAMLRRFHDAAARTMVSTNNLRSLLAANHFENLAIWPRGVDTELFKPSADNTLGLEGARPHLFYIGRVAVEKNLETFLSLATPGTKFVVGDGPARQELEKKYPATRFLGTKHGAELVAHYNAADVFVFPSLTDTLGLVMLEAMACGVPVAAFPVLGPLDVIGDSRAGVMANDLKLAVEQAAALDRSVCRPRALEFSWDSASRRFLELLEPLSPQYGAHGVTL